MSEQSSSAPPRRFPFCWATSTPSGNLNANIIHQFSEQVRCKFVAQVQNSKFMASQFSTDYRGRDFTSSLTMANIDLINDTGVIVGHYLQSVTPRVALGAELAYQYGAQVPGGQIAILSVAGKYKAPSYTVSGTVGAAGAHLCYWQKSSEQIQFGCELETNLRMQEAVGSVGYQVDLPKANLVFRGNGGLELDGRRRPREEAAAAAVHVRAQRHAQPPQEPVPAGLRPHHRLMPPPGRTARSSCGAPLAVRMARRLGSALGALADRQHCRVRGTGVGGRRVCLASG